MGVLKKMFFRNEEFFDWNDNYRCIGQLNSLMDVRKKFPITIPLVIGSLQIFTKNRIKSVNPNKPSDVVCNSSYADDLHINAAIEEAKKAFHDWKYTNVRERSDLLLKVANNINRYEMNSLLINEIGKSWREADIETCEGIDFLRFYAKSVIDLMKNHTRQINGMIDLCYMMYEPRGVVSVIAPWNFPFAITIGMISAAIVTGNAVVFKPSSLSPLLGYRIYELFKDAGLPNGVLNFVPCNGSSNGDILVKHNDVSMIVFTGSKDVGLKIVKLAGETPSDNVKQVIVEMGGKNASIVDDTANIDDAIPYIIQSSFGYSGQKCSACSRIIVMEDIHNVLCDKLVNAIGNLKVGNVNDRTNFTGAVISEESKNKIMDYIEIGKKEGKIIIRKEIDGDGYNVPITVFTNVDPNGRIAQEEIFGPLLSIIKVKTFDEALKISNSTQYALTGSIFSNDRSNINRATKEFKVGNFYINRGCTGAMVARHPFGGFKMSGTGPKVGGPDYLGRFTIARTISE